METRRALRVAARRISGFAASSISFTQCADSESTLLSLSTQNEQRTAMIKLSKGLSYHLFCQFQPGIRVDVQLGRGSINRLIFDSGSIWSGYAGPSGTLCNYL
jgi:hypothetical protein